MGGRPRARLAEIFLIVVMGVGSLFLWIGIPAGWLFIASRLSSDYPKVYLLALVFCPLTMIAFGWFLLRVNGRYLDLFPDAEERRPRGREAWLGAVGADASARRPWPALETFMSISVALAVVALGVWFFFFAGSSLPAP